MRRRDFALLGLSVYGLKWGFAAPQQTPPADSAGAAQAPPAAEPPEEAAVPATFRAQTTDVLVPVTVTDDQGKFISNLTKEDFRILDEGRPQLIRYFIAPRAASHAHRGWFPGGFE